jgi:glutaredoxin
MFKKTILLATFFSLFFLSACGLSEEKKQEEKISPEEAITKAENFINTYFMDPNNPIEIKSIEEGSQTGLYKFPIDPADLGLEEEEEIFSYISKDGKKFFPESYDISEIESALEEEAPIEEESTNNSEEISLEESTDFTSEEKVVIYFFWGEGCPHCATQKEAMEKWSQEYSDIDIKLYETWSNNSNTEILESLAANYGTQVKGVPMTFIGDEYWVGYNENLETEMKNKIEECLEAECENPGERLQ